MSTLRRLLVVVLALMALAPGLAGQTPAGTQAAIPKVEFEKYTLPNGLQVILHVDRKLPIVHVNQWFHVGSKNEKPGRTGFAHLFEHMMFQGSKNASGEYFVYAEKAGANLREGGVNGTTSNDRTNYFATVPSANLENLLWVESDRLATLLDATTKEKLDEQRGVVKNERRQGLENQPYGRWFTLLFETVYPKGHPYSWPVIGSMEDLSAATLDDVKEFFRQYYSTSNLSLAIAGDFDPAEAKKLVEKYFGDLPPGPPLDRPARNIATLDGERVVEVNDRVSLERVYFGWPTPEYFSADDAALDIAARVLTDGLSSRLNKALVYDKPVATQVSSFNISGEIGSVFVVQATARPGSSLAEIEKTVTAEIARLAKEGPTAAELERSKTKQEAEFISGLERIGGFGGKADVLNQYNTFLGDPNKIEADMTRYRSLTTASVQQAVGKWLDTPNRVLIRFHPDKSQRPSNALTLDRSAMPPLGTDRPFTAPKVETTKLANGLELYVVERRDLPKVSVTLVTRAGAVGDPAGKAGVANLTMTTIDMGTPSKKALEIEEAFGDLGTTLTGGAGRESARLGLDVLSRNLGPALVLLADVVQHPTFPEEEIARERKRVLDALAQADRNANALASRIQPMLAFGPDHPYGRPVQGLKGSVEGITRADLAAFHQARFKPGSTAIVLAGDISLPQATELVTKSFGGWTGGAAADITIPASPAPKQSRIYLVDRPDAAQTVVSQWIPGPARTTPDYDVLNLVDAVWGGGGFGTRLNLNLRENKAYSYGVFSNFNLMRAAGNWTAAGGVQTDKTSESIVEFDKELKDLAGARPITNDELALAKQRRVRGYAQQFESLDRITGEIANLWAWGLPTAELQRAYDATSAVTLEQISAASKKYVQPAQSSLLLVGDRAKIEAKVKALNLGEIVLLDNEGKPVAATGGTK
jgi:zinc protease